MENVLPDTFSPDTLVFMFYISCKLLVNIRDNKNYLWSIVSVADQPGVDLGPRAVWHVDLKWRTLLYSFYLALGGHSGGQVPFQHLPNNSERAKFVLNSVLHFLFYFVPLLHVFGRKYTNYWVRYFLWFCYTLRILLFTSSL